MNDTSLLNSIDIEILEIRDEYLDNCNNYFEKISIEDVLQLFDNNLKSDEVELWRKNRSDEWWNAFFSIMNENISSSLKDKYKSYKIFYDRVTGRTALLDDNIYFIYGDVEPIWREKYRMLDYSSEAEKCFLEKLGIKVLNKNLLANYLNLEHLSISNFETISNLDRENICYDLLFIKNEIAIDEIKLDDLIVPTVDNRARKAKQTMLYHVLSLDLKEKITKTGSMEFVDTKFIFDLLSVMDDEEKYEWEKFLYKIGCSFPDVPNEELKNLSLNVPIDNDNDIVNFIRDESQVAKYLLRKFNITKKSVKQNLPGPSSRAMASADNRTDRTATHIYNLQNIFESGVEAEKIFSNYLKDKFGSKYNPDINWVSSTRGLEHSKEGCDDSLGYDFWIEDGTNILGIGNYNKCYIEVKGCMSTWDGVFYMSENEMRKRDQIALLNDETYLICIVENIGSSTPTIYKITNFDRLERNNHSSIYKITYNKILKRL